MALRCFPEARSNVRPRTAEQMMRPVMEKGRRLRQASVEEAASYARIRLTKLYSEHKRFENPHVYKVGISDQLLKLRTELVEVFFADHERTNPENA